MTVLLTLPAYNEQDGLPPLLESFCRTMKAMNLAHRLVICDDGSRDATREVIESWMNRLPVDVSVHAVNRGLGETIRDALRLALKVAAEDDVIVTMDADNTHPPELITDMLRHIERGSDVVVASRYRPGARVVGLSRFRHVLSWGARMLCQVVCPIDGIRDYTCGFRIYRLSVLRRAFDVYGDQLVTERGFSCMTEILVKISKLKVRMSEVPLVLRYDQKAGVSKMKVGRTVVSTLKPLIRLRFGKSGRIPRATRRMVE
jgi:dolichol-phosphate mannosyltransferase